MGVSVSSGSDLGVYDEAREARAHKLSSIDACWCDRS